MDSRKFATSLSQVQKKFIAERRDGHLKLANTCVNEYKDNPSEELIRRIQSNLACVSALDYLLNQFAPLESRKAYQEFTDIKDNHEKNMALVNRNKKLEKTLMRKLVGKAVDFLEMTYMFLALGFGAGIGLFILSHIYKILEG